ncbi:MAG: transposase [Chlamydiae bacterium]|nr:transposase [Chlamydiota bacterium]MBI3265918.1 transposase [Chlamydiota bacterium]
MERKAWTKREKMAIVLEMIRGRKNVSQICREYGVNETLAHRWKEDALEGMKEALADKRQTRHTSFEGKKYRLLKVIAGQACVIELQKNIID